jgi:hypothetical protein
MNTKEVILKKEIKVRCKYLKFRFCLTFKNVVISEKGEKNEGKNICTLNVLFNDRFGIG